ncbi:macro domain-containing protein [Thermosipho atlanticus]|uniref:O-acetyl-ADP-ribose deacetylase (Regulator of RNase III), contains Macro domain n=1 Tax=Thermosipho atlanticus DSM 15807 TaxID=1123380 RepID=A0A1M5RZD8_9BACT|nr:macro domain-containing protein [Thermosipho atlanticus]SHH31722.1 O-acetyl-ADP-ribose deacetylase (regulator of RNase III), contains Macro domain [Thermosipho atlanticus DSM 15807]
MEVLLRLKVKNTMIEIVKGDITKENTEVIVNAANSHLKHGGGVAGAIVRVGGKIIQKESDEYVRKNGVVDVGNVAVTGAGNLKAKYIIHAVGPIWRGGNHNEEELLRKVVRNVLKKASELGASSVSIPAISSGIFGFPKKLCAIIFAEEIEQFLKNNETSLSLIRIVNIDELTSKIFHEVFDDKFTEEKS